MRLQDRANLLILSLALMGHSIVAKIKGRTRHGELFQLNKSSNEFEARPPRRQRVLTTRLITRSQLRPQRTIDVQLGQGGAPSKSRNRQGPTTLVDIVQGHHHNV